MVQALSVDTAETQGHSRLGWALVCVLLLLSVEALVGTGDKIRWIATGFLAFVLYRRAWDLVPAALLLFFLYVAALWFPRSVWQFPSAGFLIPFALTCLVCFPFAHLRKDFRWLRKGQIDQATLFLVVLTSLVSALALVLWALWTNYLGIATAMMGTVRSMPRWFLLLIGIPGFAIMNAFAEEAVYRGVFQEALASRFPKRAAWVIGIQASAFAAAHYQSGFPNGKLGYLMTFTYAAMLGFLRIRSEGMLAPYLAHVAADLVIGVTLLLLAS